MCVKERGRVCAWVTWVLRGALGACPSQTPIWLAAAPHPSRWHMLATPEGLKQGKYQAHHDEPPPTN